MQMDALLAFATAHPIFTVGASLALIVVSVTWILAALPKVSISQTEAEELKKADEKAKQRMWEHGLHEDNVFNERLNFFLIFESVSLGVIGALFTHSPENDESLRFLSLFGLIVTLLWLYVQARQKYVLDSIKARDSAALPDYAFILQIRRRWPLSTTWLMTYFLPFLILAMWLIVLAILDGRILSL